MEYKLSIRDEYGCDTSMNIEADSDDRALEIAKEEAIEWISGGEWGDDGASVSVYYQIENDDFIWDEEVEVVEIEPDEESLMWNAGIAPECDHEWVSTVEVDGGLKENPGVFSTGGTTIVSYSHCEICGAHREETDYGSQRNPGQAAKKIRFWKD